MARELPRERKPRLKRREAKKFAHGLAALFLRRRLGGLNDQQLGELVFAELDVTADEARLVAGYLRDIPEYLRRKMGQEWLPTRGAGA